MVSVHSGSLLAPFDKDDWAELVVCLEMVSYPRPPVAPAAAPPGAPPRPLSPPPHTVASRDERRRGLTAREVREVMATRPKTQGACT
jgi:hypothetical protein